MLYLFNFHFSTKSMIISVLFYNLQRVIDEIVFFYFSIIYSNVGLCISYIHPNNKFKYFFLGNNLLYVLILMSNQVFDT